MPDLIVPLAASLFGAVLGGFVAARVALRLERHKIVLNARLRLYREILPPLCEVVHLARNGARHGEDQRPLLESLHTSIDLVIRESVLAGERELALAQEASSALDQASILVCLLERTSNESSIKDSLLEGLRVLENSLSFLQQRLSYRLRLHRPRGDLRFAARWAMWILLSKLGWAKNDEGF